MVRLECGGCCKGVGRALEAPGAAGLEVRYRISWCQHHKSTCSRHSTACLWNVMSLERAVPAWPGPGRDHPPRSQQCPHPSMPNQRALLNQPRR